MKSLLTTLLTASFLFFSLAPQVARAATEQQVQGPVLGYLFDDDNHLLRPINGIPEAAHVAAALDLDFKPVVVTVSPRQDFALAIDAEGYLRLVDLSGVVPTSTIVDSALIGADRIFISPSGSAAAIYDRQTQAVQILEGLPTDIDAGPEFQADGLPGVFTAMAISDNAELVAAVAERSGGALYLLSPDGAPVRIGPVQRVLSLAFVPGSGDALAADYDASQLLLIRDVATLAQITVIASSDDGVTNPHAIAASADGDKAVAVFASGVAMVPLNGGAVELIDCACTPTTLDPLAGGTAFRLTETAGAPIHLIDVSGDPRMLFVPAALDAEQAASLTPDASPAGRAQVRALRGNR